ncbi:30S ribosomal protein S3 [Candidatus Woesearchaeota archaeon]|nr:30S ribosomal protein S3 [Candidatus Woesearchaeota archaeon]
MIERKFIAENIKEFEIGEYISQTLKNVGHSHTKLQRTPLGEKIIIFASRPGLIVGRKGENIKKLTNTLKKRFNLENPQIEISEVANIGLEPQIIAERIASTMERFGSDRFKGIGHKTMEEVMNSGARGIEINISGKIPGARAKSWRFYRGYLKKCGDIAVHGVRTAYAYAQLKTGTVGVKVSIMPPDIRLPDDVRFTEKEETKSPLLNTPAKGEVRGEEKPKKKRAPRKKAGQAPKASKAGDMA